MSPESGFNTFCREIEKHIVPDRKKGCSIMLWTLAAVVLIVVITGLYMIAQTATKP